MNHLHRPWAPLALSFGFACAAESAPEAPSTDEAMSATARTEAARAPEARALVEAPARVVALRPARAEIAPLHAARVLSLEVGVGDRVEENAPIAKLAIPELARAAADVGGLGSRLEVIGRRLETLKALEKDGLSRAEPIFSLELEQRSLRSELGAARALLSSYSLARADVAQLRRHGWVTLRSPISGIVTHRIDRVGAVIGPGDGPVARVERAGEARVEASWAAPLPEGVKLSFHATDGRALALGSTPVNSLLDASSGRMRTWLSIEDDIALPDGLFGRVLAKWPDDVVQIPSAALSDGTVRVRVDGAPRAVPVEVLSRTGSDALVRGLEVGDAVEVER